MGGDEFAALLDAPCDELNARRVAERLQRSMETAAQAVTDLGCGFGQGFLFSRPLPPADAARFARAHPLGQDRPLGGKGS